MVGRMGGVLVQLYENAHSTDQDDSNTKRSWRERGDSGDKRGQHAATLGHLLLSCVRLLL